MLADNLERIDEALKGVYRLAHTLLFNRSCTRLRERESARIGPPRSNRSMMEGSKKLGDPRRAFRPESGQLIPGSRDSVRCGDNDTRVAPLRLAPIYRALHRMVRLLLYLSPA